MFNEHRPKEPNCTHELDSHTWQSTYIHMCHNNREWGDFCLAQWFVYAQCICTGIPVLDSKFNQDISQFSPIPSFSFDLC